MKKMLILVVALMMLVGCNADTLESKMAGEWLLMERHMIIEFDDLDQNYVEFKDTFDLESQVQTRYIRYSADEEYVLDSEYPNITSFYTQTFDEENATVANYVKTEVTHYNVTYTEDTIHYIIDESKSSKEYVDVYEVNGFDNKVTFEDENMILELNLTAEDFADDPNYASVISINATMTLIEHESKPIE